MMDDLHSQEESARSYAGNARVLAQVQNTWIHGVSMTTMAARLGTYRETTGALLCAFKRQGFVELGYNRIRVVDVESLQELSGITKKQEKYLWQR